MSEPKYLSLAKELERDIMSGMYGYVGALPEESELARVYGLSRGTVRSALTWLQGKGLIMQRGHNLHVNRIHYPMIGYVPPVAERLQAIGRKGYIDNMGDVVPMLLPMHLAQKAHIGSIPAVLQTCIVGEIINQEKSPTQLAKYYWTLSLNDDEIRRMEQDARFDPVNDKAATRLSREDEIFARLPTQEEINCLRIPADSVVLCCLSVVREIATKNVVLVQEDAYVSRITFTYFYQFDNRPVSQD